jgi:hypothetical protein
VEAVRERGFEQIEQAATSRTRSRSVHRMV